MGWLDDIGKNLPVADVYKDVAQPAAREVGSALGNAVRVARLLLAPIDYLAAQSGRWHRYLERVAANVPDDRRIEAAPQVAGPVLEGLRYVDEGSILAELFVNLLSRAIDRDRVSEAHPAFAAIISQLSPDEAIVIWHLHQKEYSLRQSSSFDRDRQVFYQRITIANEFPVSDLAFPQNFFLYIDHLHSLNLAGAWQQGNQTPTHVNGVQSGVLIDSVTKLTLFGKMFATACVPEKMNDDWRGVKPVGSANKTKADKQSERSDSQG
jgi:hypothetical protein